MSEKIPVWLDEFRLSQEGGETKEPSLPEAIQAEVARLRNMIAETNALLPGGQVNWGFYNLAISRAEKAVREQDTAAMVRMLPELKEMQ